MTIVLYLHTSAVPGSLYQPEDLEEEESIRRTVRDHVIPRLKCDSEPVEYCRIDEGRHIMVVLHRSGSRKNSVIAGVRKELEKIRREWARLYRFDVLPNDHGSHYIPDGNVHTMTVVDELTGKAATKEENADGHTDC